MMLSDRIQQLVHATDVGGGARWFKYLAVGLGVFALLFTYDLRCYRNFSSVEAMDAAQVGRNLAEGNGFSTLYIRPFSIYLLRQHNQAKELSTTNAVDVALLEHPHPDLANAPVYPTILAAFFKVWKPDWSAQTTKSFWSEGNSFRRYPPEFFIAIFNQILLLVAIFLTYYLAKKLFDPTVGFLAAVLMLGSEILLRFSISGLSTMLLLVVFLGLILCLVKIEEAARDTVSDVRWLFGLALVVGLLMGVGMMIRYSFGWVIVPVTVYLILFGGARRAGMAVTTGLTFTLVILPWIIRNLSVSGTLFGTAGYAVAESTLAYPESRLMQSLDPNLTLISWISLCIRKFASNTRMILQNGLVPIAGVWVGVLFFAGLLLGIRNQSARRLRYFTLLCLVVLIMVQALGQTGLSSLSPEINTENMLVLLTPLLVIFAVVFFLTLLDQMKTLSLQIRYAVIGLLVLVACLPLISALLPPKVNPVAYPPYYPPEIQRIVQWMRPDELMMSDVPWAVAWYGQHQCVHTTVNSQSDFFQLNDYNKPVKGLYLTLLTLNAKLMSECLQGGVDSWPNFALKTVAGNAIPTSFPLKSAPYGLSSGLFLTDRIRWQTQ